MKNVELAKVLAVCIAHIDSKFKQLSESLQDLEHQVSPEIQPIAEASPVSLPDGIIFESHLDEALVSVTRKISLTKKDLGEDIGALQGELETSKTYLSQLIEQVDSEVKRSFELHSHAEEVFSGIDHSHDYLPESDFETFRESLQEELSQTAEKSSVFAEETSGKILNILEEISSIETHSREELKRIDETFKTLQGIDDSLNSKLNEAVQAVDELKEASEVAQEAIRSDLSKSVCEAIDKSETALRTLRGEFWTGLNRVQSALSSHQHPELSAVDHQHPELANADDVKNIASQIQEILTNDIQVKSALTALTAELNKKVDTLDVWHKSEIPALTDELAARVSAKIEMPKDGKNAKEWDFKFHPSIPGIFMYKREDWKDYKRVNLIRNVPKVNDGAGFVMGGGGGGSTPAPFEKILSGTDITILEAEHERLYRPTVEVFNADGELVITDVSINTINSVRIRSLIDLTGHIAIIR